ncbi:unnamed protein product [Brachionus calyciflorus]|uniref:FLYWCH-type domain-containing protein n=1 Tax=Brachionus calyciflorus TaxID=104777 RepID=A0A814NZ11_9BILA|nr:unnamed protein product [Brachionus calyciflorus]
MSKYSLIPTEKVGKHFLYHNHRLYNKLKERDIYGITICRCRKYYSKSKCRVLLRSNDAGEVVSIKSIHKDHEDVKNAEVTMLVARNSAKENIRASKGPVQKVFEKTINKAIAESQQGLKDASKFAPKYKNISKTLYKIKNKDQVSKDKLPNQIEDINFEGDLNEYTMTNCKNRFLLYDDKQEERIICFASNIQLEILSKCKRWHVDGTFRASPSLFYQVYLIHGWLNNEMHSCAYIFLRHKNKNSYSRMIDQLKRNAIVHGFVFQPEVIVGYYLI